MMKTMITMKTLLLITACIALLITVSVFLPQTASASGTTSLHVVKYANDRTTVLNETTITIPEMQAMPIQGDGTTHYYHQGPTFDSENMWDPDETLNPKDHGALRGTDLKDLCDLVGGMSAGDEVTVMAADGFKKFFTYDCVYNPQPRQGKITICWEKDGLQAGPSWPEGMRLVVFAQTLNADGFYEFGNWDMHECFPEQYWHYYYSDGVLYPSSNGFTVQNISEVAIFSQQVPPTPTPTLSPTPTPEPTLVPTPEPTPTPVPTTPPGGGGGGYLPPVPTFTLTLTPTLVPTPTATPAQTVSSRPEPTSEDIDTELHTLTPVPTFVKTTETLMSTQTSTPITSTPQSVVQAGSTTSVHIVKYASDGITVLSGRTVDYLWMEGNLPILGDGITHYYHQGPVFEGDMWDPEEMMNLKDKGAVKGTDVKDLCELVGGMSPNDEVMLVAVDGYYLKFAYENVYEPQDRQGPIGLCWYKAEDPGSGVGHGYPGNNAYSEALQVVFFAQTTNAEGKHVFGNSDMLVCFPDEKYQHFFEGLPSTNGLTGKWISEIMIYPVGAPVAVPTGQLPQPVSESAEAIPTDTIVLGSIGILFLCMTGIVLFGGRKGKGEKRNKILRFVAILYLIIGIFCIVEAVVVYAQEHDNQQYSVEWYVTIKGVNGEQKVLSYDEIKAMPSYEGWGGSFSTAGIVSGPYRVKGVTLESLCELVGGITPSQAVIISAVDGYSMVYDYDQIKGKFDTYDPQTMKLTPHGELKLILMFEQNGKPLPQEDGKPLRIAIAGTDKLIIEGHYWVKWVNGIEIMNIYQ